MTSYEQVWMRRPFGYRQKRERRSASLTAWLKLSLTFGIVMFSTSPDDAAASTFMCTGGPNEQQVGIDTSNPSVSVPLCVSTPTVESGDAGRNGRRDITPYRPPGYKPPPRPKGWQKQWTGFAAFIVHEDERGDADKKPVYDYSLAMNYPSAAEARAAAEGMCRLRGRFTRSMKGYYRSLDDYCRSNTWVLEEPFIRIGVKRYGQVSVDQDVNPVRAAKVSRKIGGKSYNCSSDQANTPELCNYWVLAVIPNGLHQRPPVTGFDTVFPCPDGPESNRYKIVGVDRKTGLFVALCGPDLAVWN
ncbi:hypothetical protein [Altererythrobacter sp. Z27]|uniref:hypothetical protein n=1 Tax=Altererythrobacter sp. Z27 TaxID=3461147 RepID=UPI0040449387